MLNSNKITNGGSGRVTGISIGNSGQMAYIYNESGDLLNFRFKTSSGTTAYSNMAWIVESIQSFQTGVNTLYNKCVSCGVTPSAKTPAAISTAIQTIYTNRYNAGYNAAGGDIKHSVYADLVDRSWNGTYGYGAVGLFVDGVRVATGSSQGLHKACYDNKDMKTATVSV